MKEFSIQFRVAIVLAGLWLAPNGYGGEPTKRSLLLECPAALEVFAHSMKEILFEHNGLKRRAWHFVTLASDVYWEDNVSVLHFLQNGPEPRIRKTSHEPLGLLRVSLRRIGLDLPSNIPELDPSTDDFSRVPSEAITLLLAQPPHKFLTDPYYTSNPLPPDTHFLKRFSSLAELIQFLGSEGKLENESDRNAVLAALAGAGLSPEREVGVIDAKAIVREDYPTALRPLVDLQSADPETKLAAPLEVLALNFKHTQNLKAAGIQTLQELIQHKDSVRLPADVRSECDYKLRFLGLIP